MCHESETGWFDKYPLTSEACVCAHVNMNMLIPLSTAKAWWKNRWKFKDSTDDTIPSIILVLCQHFHYTAVEQLKTFPIFNTLMLQYSHLTSAGSQLHWQNMSKLNVTCMQFVNRCQNGLITVSKTYITVKYQLSCKAIQLKNCADCFLRLMCSSTNTIVWYNEGPGKAVSLPLHSQHTDND